MPIYRMSNKIIYEILLFSFKPIQSVLLRTRAAGTLKELFFFQHSFRRCFLSMSISSQYFEVIADFAGIEGDANYIAVIKGDIVRLIKKDKELFTIEKNGHIGKVPK
ncbi:MAG: hypothetical protein EZS28_021586 [Streblomastix strix]|uniref:SH3 domain-containing protein n=1 Tax=Streblomastix strix TaxID=222440 RepID=A0A5J4VKA1_9EUKA|nr:MAG: hypothetical protein EZS28_021586 [Streblomastix strix]